MEPYYVYILRCRDGSLYTGITNDVAHRLRLHRSGKGAKYTRAHPPEAVAAVWRCGGKAEAARLEYAIKATPEGVGEWFPALTGEYTPVEVPAME